MSPQENRHYLQQDDYSNDRLSQEIFKEPLVNLYKSSQSAAALIRSNLFITELNLPKPNIREGLGIDDKDDCVSLQQFVQRAKKGFVLRLKSEHLKKEEELEALKDTALDFTDDNPYVAYPWNDLFAFGSFIGTLNNLRKSGVVNFRTFKPVDSLDLGDRIEKRKSLWHKHDPEFVWSLLEKLTQVTDELLEYPKIPEYSENDAFVIGHFLSASAQLAHEVVQSKT